MRAATWWIDRWRKSTAYTDMTLAQQGAYRNLLDECWLRPGGIIPSDDRILQKIAGATPGEWTDMGPVVMARFRAVEGGYVNETALAVISHFTRKAAPTTAHLGCNDVLVCRKIDEVHHPHQFQERRYVIGHGLTNHEHQISSIGTI